MQACEGLEVLDTHMACGVSTRPECFVGLA
jgi:hypothetical protein